MVVIGLGVCLIAPFAYLCPATINFSILEIALPNFAFLLHLLMLFWLAASPCMAVVHKQEQLMSPKLHLLCLCVLVSDLAPC